MNAMRSACSEHEQLDAITARLSIALLRHSDILPMDRTFYEAGIMCRKVGWNEMSMMFLNRYLDVVDAIEERNPEMLATSDFVETDIPYEIDLPEQPSLSSEHHEKIKEHVLTLSMKQAVGLRSMSRSFDSSPPISFRSSRVCVVMLATASSSR